jgi:hypothetical protein
MRRRVFIAIFGSALLGGTALLWRNLSSVWRSRIDELAAQTVKALTDLMFPGDELPGATKLGIHNRVLAMAELRDTVAEGVGWLDRNHRTQSRFAIIRSDVGDRATQSILIPSSCTIGVHFAISASIRRPKISGDESASGSNPVSTSIFW